MSQPLPQVSTIEKMAKPFSAEWWKSYYENTAELTRPKVFQDALSDSDIQKLTNCVRNIIKNVCDPSLNIKNGFRVSIEGEIEGSHRNLFYGNGPLDDEDLIAWCSRIFNSKKFGVILNSVHNYDPELKAEISEKFAPLLELYGVPPQGLEITLFFGNYGYTPLGFHVDPVGHKVTHLHLGPGRKEMFLIEKNKFEKVLNAKTGSKEFAKLTPESEVYDFEKGDLFFMPPDIYHVGNTEELSFGLTVWHVEPSIAEFQTKISIDLMRKIFSKEDGETMIMRDKNNADNTSQTMEVLNSVIEFDPDYENLALKDCLDNLVKEFRYKLFSNGYFYGFLQEDIREKKYIPVELTLNSKVSGVKPFKIQLMETESYSKLFVQGKVFNLPKSSNVKLIVETINSYEQILLKDLFKLHFDEWDEDLILYISQEMFKRGGIEIIN